MAQELGLIPDAAEPRTANDEEIVARVCAGEVELFELLMRRNNQRVYRAVRAILKNDSEAEDVMQDAYGRAYEHLREFEGRARFSTWLTRIAVHEAFARVRRRSRLASFETQPEEAMPSHPASSPEEQTSDIELRSVLESAVEKLSDEFRAVFVLRAVEGMSGAETAECLGIPEDTVKTRLHRARGKLRDIVLQSIEPAVPALYEFHLSRCDRVVNGVLRKLGIRTDAHDRH